MNTKHMVDVFGFQVPTDTYYLHRGHAWAVIESDTRVRVGLDDFSQKILGPADDLRLPTVGKTYYQGHICAALVKQGVKASFVAPVDGVIAALNPEVAHQPRLVHDDPYGAGWLFLMEPTNLKRNLANLSYGQANLAFMEGEAHRLLGLMNTAVGFTLPDGGAIIDDVVGHYPELGWRRLVQTFLLQDLTRPSNRRGFEGWDDWARRNI